MLDNQWDEAVLEVPRGAGGSTIFVECRADLTTEVASGESTLVRQTAWTGAGVDRDDGSFVYHSDIVPDQLHDLVAGQPPPTRRNRSSTQTPLDPSWAIGAVVGTVVEAQRRFPEASFRARWVESQQEVKVGCADGVIDDLRKTRRIRLDGALQRAGCTAWAAAERVVGTDIPVAILVEEVIERLEARLDALPAPRGPAIVVFAPGVAGVWVHELVGHAAEADRVARGVSWLSGEHESFPQELSVIDDPRRARAAWHHDDEGTPARPVALIHEGKARGLLQSSHTANLTGREKTGHGRRGSFRERALPRMGCTFVANGHRDPLEILQKVQQGIYVRRMESAQTDPATGLALFRVTDADRIVNGKIDVALKAHLLETRAPQGLAAIDGIGDDLEFDRCIGTCHREGQPLSTSVGAPTICTRLMTVRF